MNKYERQALFKEKGLIEYWQFFEPILRNTIRISLRKDKEDNFALGESKIGGLPDLPKNIDWFKWKGNALSFIAQINCAEVKSFDVENLLPEKGILSFFYHAEQETWGFDPKDKGSFKVFYYDKPLTEIERKEPPNDLPEYAWFRSCKLSFYQDLDIPYYTESIFNRLTDKELDNYFDLLSNINKGLDNKILGYSNNIQGKMELECELVTNGLYCGDGSGFHHPMAKELEKNIEDWQLLLQIDSNEDDAGMLWGDVGRIYFWIKKQNLLRLDFEKSWFILQCY